MDGYVLMPRDCEAMLAVASCPRPIVEPMGPLPANCRDALPALVMNIESRMLLVLGGPQGVYLAEAT